MISTLDEFTLAYVEAALWSTNDESNESGGVPLDENYSIEDIDCDTLKEMAEDCRKFQEENSIDLGRYDCNQHHRRWSAEEMGGHDFWLTRNGHGAGFWDGDWPKEVGKRLTEACRKCGEYYLYVGDDGKIYRY